MRTRHIVNTTIALALTILLGACASKKAATEVTGVTAKSAKSTKNAVVETASPEVKQLAYTKKVVDNAVYAKNIVGSMQFNLKTGSKDISVPGSLHMRFNEVIRLQLFLPLLGTEVGRLEFTPDYVLVVDRIHKEYIQASYTQVDFLHQNGLSFYSLQALFWNQLTVPGTKTLNEKDLSRFSVELDKGGTNVPLTLANGKMSYRWTTEQATGRILQALVTYVSNQTGRSQLTWDYSNFKSVGPKSFPAKQVFSFSSAAVQKGAPTTVTISMSEVKTDDKWEARTTVSNKYKRVEAQDILGKLLKM